jgi:hypothetical protein
VTGVRARWIRTRYQLIASVAPSKPIMLAEVDSIEAGNGGAKKGA